MRGFTIVEMVLYVSLLSILLLIFTEVLGTIVDVRLESEATSSVEQDSRFILARMAHDIRRASAILIPASLGNETSSLQLTIDGINYTYGQSGANLTLSNHNGTQQLSSVGTTVSNLRFQRIGNALGKDTVRMNFTLESVAVRKSGTERRSFQTTFGLR